MRGESLKILILGGTGGARELAVRLVGLGHDVTTTLAGVTTAPILPESKVRIGGFGGVGGLVDFLHSSGTELLIDATHPFAAQMSANAQDAAELIKVPLLRLERPQWQRQVGDNWIEVASMKEAISALPAGARAMVTTGRKSLDLLYARDDLSGIIRVVEPLRGDVPAQWRQVLDRPPYHLAHEQTLFAAERVTHLVTKNAGGDSTSAKLEAARSLKLPIIMLHRPSKPTCPTFASVDDLVAQLGTGDIGG